MDNVHDMKNENPCWIHLAHIKVWWNPESCDDEKDKKRYQTTSLVTAQANLCQGQIYYIEANLCLMKYELTFSRRTLFINDPFSLVGNDVGQPICVESEEGVKLQKGKLPAEEIKSLHKAMLTSSLLRNKAELRCHVTRFVILPWPKMAIGQETEHTLSKNNASILSSLPRAFLENNAALEK